MHYGEEISPSVLRAAADSSSSQHYSAASDTYPQIENIICRPSKLQKVLRGAVENLVAHLYSNDLEDS
jgi:hypothetical protein